MFTAIFVLGLFCVCFGDKTNTKILYCPDTFGVTSGVEPNFNISGVSPGAQYVQDNLTCYSDKKYKKPVLELYTFCTKLMEYNHFICVNTAAFLEGSGRIVSTGDFIDDGRENELVIIGGSKKYRGLTGTATVTRIKLNNISSIFVLIYKANNRKPF